MSEERPAPNRDIQLQIQLDETVAQGVYSNLAMVNHTETEFVLDFIFVQPHQPRAKVRSRVIGNPRHTKRLLLALQDNIDKYEQKFGTIEVTNLPLTPPAIMN